MKHDEDHFSEKLVRGTVSVGGAKVLYLSYDGMCDPLGGSQVLPYLFGLRKLGHEISLISFEKPERSAGERAAVKLACEEAGIRWYPLAYHKRPPVLSGMYDVWRMYWLAWRLNKQQRFDLVHCRSYLPALVGLRLNRLRGVPFIFDMRGFWADERVDGRIWNLSNPLVRTVYKYFKKREAEFLDEAAHVVSLTEEGKSILLGWRAETGPPITVIPCCVDFSAFPPITDEQRCAARRMLGIAPEATVAVYLGSVGSWYLFQEMLDFFRVQLERNSAAIFLLVSREPAEQIMAAAEARSVPADRLLVRAASRTEVPKLVAAANYGLFFIKPVFSKKASSPTKLAEMLALELPVVTNGEVGDVAKTIADTGAGVIVSAFNVEAYHKALEDLGRLAPDMNRWRVEARRWYDLDTGVDRYSAIYQNIMAAPKGRQHGR